MVAREFRRLLPVRNDLFFPLPVEGRRVLRRPAVGDPVRIGVIGIAAWTSRESDNYFHIQFLRQQHGFSKSFRIAVGNGLVGMHRVPMTTEGRDQNVAVVKLLSPRLQLRRIRQQVINRAMFVVGITAGPDLRRFHSEARVFINELIEREIWERGIENADGNFAPCTGRGRACALGLRYRSRQCAWRRHGASNDASSSSQKTSASGGERIELISHEVPRRGVAISGTLYA